MEAANGGRCTVTLPRVQVPSSLATASKLLPLRPRANFILDSNHHQKTKCPKQQQFDKEEDQTCSGKKAKEYSSSFKFDKEEDQTCSGKKAKEHSSSFKPPVAKFPPASFNRPLSIKKSHFKANPTHFRLQQISEGVSGSGNVVNSSCNGCDDMIETTRRPSSVTLRSSENITRPCYEEDDEDEELLVI